MTGLHLSLNPSPALRRVAWLRPLLGHNIMNGLSVGVGLGVLSTLVYLLTGPVIAASASVGMLVISIGDRTAPSRGKWRQLAPLLWMAAPLTLGVQLAHLLPEYTTVLLGVLVCAGGFIGMLGTAWGLRGGPVGFALLLAIVFSMSTPPPPSWREAVTHVAWFQLGAILYAAYAIATAWALNTRFRALALAEALTELAVMLRHQGARLAATADRRESQLRSLLTEQAVLADKLQVARDLVLDLPRTDRQLSLAAMLIAAIRLREQALASELELDMRGSRATFTLTLDEAQEMERLWREFAEELDRVCWRLFVGAGRAPRGDPLTPPLQALVPELPSPIDDVCAAMAAEMETIVRLGLAHRPSPPDLAAQSRDWPKFRTSMRWPLAPLKRAMVGQSPVLRYAVRVAVALCAGYLISLHLPWAAHPHWILLTIAVVMRNNIAQTLERRNARVLGTFIGCILVTALLSLDPPVPLEFAVMATAAGVAHGFVQVRYLIAATAATVLALIQGHLLGTAGEFALLERLADTVIGTLIAWAFSYVLPAWERRQLPALLKRLATAQVQHAKVALTSSELASANADWRLARREVLDSLAAIANAAQRALSEPLAVQPPLDLLERVQLRSYRLLAQLGGVRTWREQPQALPASDAEPLLQESLSQITAGLQPPIVARETSEASDTQPADETPGSAPVATLSETVSAHDENDLLLQRLHDAVAEAVALGQDLAKARAWEAARAPERQR